MSEAAGPPRTWHRTAAFVAGTVSMLVLSVVASLALWIALPWAFLGWTPTLVVSGSMSPLISPGDVVMLRPAAVTDLGTNTVVLYDGADSGRVLHRIVEVLGDGSYRTQGDANTTPDSAVVTAAQVQGAAVLSIPWIGQASLWLHDGDVVPLLLTGLTVAVLLALAPRAFDPAFDPWATTTRRVSPAELLLGRVDARPDRRSAADGRRLLPVALHDLVHQRLAQQSGVARGRATRLMEGLS